MATKNYYIYRLDSTAVPHGDYKLEIYENDGCYESAREFYNECIDSSYYPYDDIDNNDFEEIINVSLKNINDKIKVYYLDYEMFSDKLDTIVYPKILGTIKEFYDMNSKKYVKAITKLLKKNNINFDKEWDCFIILANNEAVKIDDISNEWFYTKNNI